MQIEDPISQGESSRMLKKFLVETFVLFGNACEIVIVVATILATVIWEGRYLIAYEIEKIIETGEIIKKNFGVR
jgi:hypothetical protein